MPNSISERYFNILSPSERTEALKQILLFFCHANGLQTFFVAQLNGNNLVESFWVHPSFICVFIPLCYTHYSSSIFFLVCTACFVDHCYTLQNFCRTEQATRQFKIWSTVGSIYRELFLWIRLIGQKLEPQAVVIYVKWKLYVILQFSTMFPDCFPLCHSICDLSEQWECNW